MSIPPQITKAPTEIRWSPETLLWVGWQHKGWVVVGLAIGLIVSAAVGFLIPRSYQSTAQISIIKKTPDAVAGLTTRNLAAEENMSPPQDLLKSSLIIERAIQSKNLQALSIEVPADQDLTEHIRNMLTVAAGKGAHGPNLVFKLNFRARNPEDCQTVLAALLDSYKEFMDKKHQSVSADTLELILRDKQKLEKEIAQNEVAYREFREKAPLLGKGRDGLELRQERLNSIQTKRSAMLLQKVELEGQLSALETGLKEGRGQDVMLAMLVEFMRKGDASDAGRQDQLFPLLMEERKLIQVHGANHDAVKEIRQRIEVARRLMVLPATAWQGEGTSVDPVKLHIQLLKQKLHHLQVSEGLLVGVFQSEQDEARRLASFEIQNDAFRTRSTMNQQLYETLVKRLNDVSLIRNVGGYQIEMLESPSIGKRVAPSMTISLAVGAILGLFLGLVIACRVEARSDR